MTATIVDRGRGLELLIRRPIGDMYIPTNPEAVEKLMRSCESALAILRRPAREWR